MRLMLRFRIWWLMSTLKLWLKWSLRYEKAPAEHWKWVQDTFMPWTESRESVRLDRRTVHECLCVSPPLTPCYPSLPTWSAAPLQTITGVNSQCPFTPTTEFYIQVATQTENKSVILFWSIKELLAPAFRHFKIIWPPQNMWRSPCRFASKEL